MAEIWAAGLAAGATAYGAYTSSQAGKAGAAAQKGAANAANAEQAREFDIAQQNQQPFLQAGQNAVNLQQRYLSGDTSGFNQSPDYQFAVQQGTQALDRGAAAKGNLWGGGADADRISLGQGLATQYATNYWNKLAGMAGQGQTSANQLGVLGANVANQTGNNLTNAAQANASSYANSANSWNNALGQIGNIAGQYYQQNGNPFATTSSGTSYSNLGNTAGNYWSNPSYSPSYGSSGGNYNFAAMSGGG
jgi:hypothetical protein